MKNILFSTIITLGLILSACGTPQRTTPPETPVVKNEITSEIKLPPGYSIENTSRGKLLVCPNPVRFLNAKTVFAGNAEETLDTIALIIMDNQGIMFTIIEGHASTQGKAYKYNYDLSQRRAQVVYNYLLKRGVPKEKLKTYSYGEQIPIYKTHAENRRDEFVFILTEDELKIYDDFYKTVDIKKER